MKTGILTLLLIFIAALGMSGCERNDYQHPLHRNNQNK
ncbi:Uncharacterised protein [Wolinella succinogenes]|nr:Uncharacterised protein [Wolinella succinogenes]